MPLNSLKRTSNQRRIKSFMIGQRDLLDLFANRLYMDADGISWVTAVDYGELPNDMEILGVRNSISYRGFVVHVSHPSFPEIPDGALLTPTLLNLKRVMVATDDPA